MSTLISIDSLRDYPDCFPKIILGVPPDCFTNPYINFTVVSLEQRFVENVLNENLGDFDR